MDNDKGVTRILANTEKAQLILKEIQEDTTIMEIPVDEAVSGVHEMLHSVKMSPRRERFFELTKMGGVMPYSLIFRNQHEQGRKNISVLLRVS